MFWSFSMACSVDEDVDSDAMAPTYEKTRWSVTINAVEKFLDEFLSEGTSNKVSVISYCGSARTEIMFPDKNTIWHILRYFL